MNLQAAEFESYHQGVKMTMVPVKTNVLLVSDVP